MLFWCVNPKSCQKLIDHSFTLKCSVFVTLFACLKPVLRFQQNPAKNVWTKIPSYLYSNLYVIYIHTYRSICTCACPLTPPMNCNVHLMHKWLWFSILNLCTDNLMMFFSFILQVNCILKFKNVFSVGIWLTGTWHYMLFVFSYY